MNERIKTEKTYKHLFGNKHSLGNKPNKTSFKKGLIPWNKGLKGTHFSPETEFKKGRTSNRTLEVGTIRIRKSKRNKIRAFIKVKTPNIWVDMATYNWEKHFGKLKKGDVIHHLNSNTLDNDINNLIALPRSDHPKFHNRYELKQLSYEQLSYYHKRYLEHFKLIENA